MRHHASRPMIPAPPFGLGRGIGLELKDGGGLALEDPPAGTDEPAGVPARDRQDKRQKSLTAPLEIKLDSVDPNTRMFEGLAAAFSLDLGGDVIMPGAFKRTIADWKKSGRIIPLLDSHNGHGTVLAAVGKVLDLKETPDGLWMKAEIIGGDVGDEVLLRVKGGFVDGLSIGYRPVKIKVPTDEEQLQGIWRFLPEVALKEVSVCLWPMNLDARIDLGSLKHLLAESKSRSLDPDELDDLREVHRQIGALLLKSAPAIEVPAAPKAEGLAPEDPRRVALDAKLRDLRLRGLGIPLA